MNGVYYLSNYSAGNQYEYGIGHRGEYIDVYSHNISTRYSEVYWTMQPSVPLPADFVKRFDGKIVALTGYECDSVRIHPDGTEESVPITHQYNHHHNAYITGKATKLVDVGPVGSSNVPMHGGIKSRWEPRPVPGVSSSVSAINGAQVPTGAFIVDGNGGEYRKSFHGTTVGTAMLVQSPSAFSIQPMMINTKNPNGGNKVCDSRGPNCPLPKASRAPAGASYSGLLECPCTDRKKKVITNHNTLESGTCPTAVDTAAACFSTMAGLGLTPVMANNTVNTATGVPPGCSVVATQKGYEVTFNTNAKSPIQCGPASATGPIRSLGDEEVVGVKVSVDLDAGVNCTAPPKSANLAGAWAFLGSKQFPGTYSITFSDIPGSPTKFKVTTSAPNPCNPACEGELTGLSFAMTSGFKLSGTISADFQSITWSNKVVWARQQSCNGTATITLQGPSDVWFGAGFGGSGMKGTYAVVVDGANGAVSERTLGDHDPGQQLPSSVTVLSNEVVAGVRTVTLSRGLVGASGAHFTFDAKALGVPLIAAVGSTPTFSYHKTRGSSTLMLVRTGSPMCICAGGESGSIDGVAFRNHCQPRPLSDMLALKNPVCFLQTYKGGLKCCAHKSILLDSTQTVPPALDTYRMKFRIYFEEYTSQRNAFFMFWTNEQGAGEYAVPQCAPGTPPSECVYTTTSLFKVRDSMHQCRSMSDVWCAPNWNEEGEVMLLRAGTHCHAPACIETTLYVCPDDVAWCNSTNAKLLCRNTPLYGAGKADRFDEPHYAAGIPPCLWGTEEQGLQPPPRVKLDTNLFMIKKVNSTNYHHGVMGQWQMRGAWV